MGKLGKALIMLMLQCDIFEGAMTMQQLVKSILANPYDFTPDMFSGHCGLQSLVSVAQECSEKPQELQSALTHHQVLVLHLERLAAV